jgi:AcrR family transcriptional regulator
LVAAEAILIATNDQAALSIRAVASAVGVTPPAIYRHFEGRSDLVFAVCERQASQLQAAMARAAEGLSDPWERLRARGRAYLSWALDNPEHYRVLMMSRPEETPNWFVDARLADTAGLAPVSADVAEAQDAGLMVQGDPLALTEQLWMVIHGLASLLISKPAFPFGSPEEVFERVFEMVRVGLHPRR